MRAAVLALALVAATAAPAGWSYMDDTTACLHDGASSSFMTCALPAATTYDNAFNLAASLPSCGKHSEDCYDDKLCRYVLRMRARAPVCYAVNLLSSTTVLGAVSLLRFVSHACTAPRSL